MKMEGEISGWKCGATNAAAQELLGLSEPFRGPLYPDMMIEVSEEHDPLEPFAIDKHGISGVEAEFGLWITQTLTPRDEPYTMREVFESVGGVSPVLEICCSRFVTKQAAPWIVADGANAGLILRGEPKPLNLVDLVGSGAQVSG